MSAFQCQECNRKFKTVAAAERAANNGCPGCGGCDIDLARSTFDPKEHDAATKKLMAAKIRKSESLGIITADEANALIAQIYPGVMATN